MSVSKHPIGFAVADQTDADARDRVADRNTRRHQGQRRTANRRHRRRAVGFQNVTDHANRVREIFGGRQDRRDAAFGQAAVTDFATTRAADRATFADRERREVVIQHELLAVLVHQAIDALFVAGRAQRDRDQGLRFATLEQRRTVDAWQQVGFAVDRTQRLSVASVRASAGDDQVANDFFFQVVPNGLESLGVDRTVGARRRE